MQTNRLGIITGSTLIALSLSLCGYFLSDALYKVRFFDRTVVAKGFSERDVKSNLAVLRMDINIKGNDLSKMLGDLKGQEKILLDFLKKHTIPEENIRFKNLHTQDLLNTGFPQPSLEKPQFRYALGENLVVRSSDVDAVSQAISHQNDLVSLGVMIGWSNVSYYFTELNQLRPLMLSESIKSAQEVAEQMARDCDSHLGRIRTLNQGVFSITGQDQNSGAQNYDDSSSLYKKIRIVSTLSYFLKD